MSFCKRLRMTGGFLVLTTALATALAHAHDWVPTAGKEAATWSLSAGEHGTCPNTITREDNTIVIDLSSLPERADVFRAVLRCRRDDKPGTKFRWTNTAVDEGKQVQTGEAVADDLGLVTVERVMVTKNGNRVRLLRRKSK